MSPLAELLAQGQAFHRAGNLLDAQRCYQQAIQADPAQAEAHLLLGIVLAEQGNLDEAIACLQQAWRLSPRSVEVSQHLRNALAAKHNQLGLAFALQDQVVEAVAYFRQAVELKPDDAQAHNNLGVAYERQGRLDEAVACYRQAVQVHPDYAEAYANLGVALERQDQLDEAVASYRRALVLKPDHVEAHNSLGVVLERLNRLDEAEVCFRRTLELKPDYAEAHSNLAGVLERQDRLDEALACLRQALHLKPGCAEAHNNLGELWKRQGRLDEALVHFRRSLAWKPDDALAHLNYGLTLLLRGEFSEGWPEYEWRCQCQDVQEQPLPQPRWTGSTLEGKTILLRGEQGWGDALQFVRYAELVKQQGATVVVECRPPLVRLLATCPGVDRVVATTECRPEFDVHLPLPSLPGVFRTSLDNIPAKIPYLFPDAALVAQWKDTFRAEQAVKIGIAWQGAPGNKADRYRSFPLARFAGIARMPEVRLYSLQMGAGREQLTTWTGPCSITDLGDRLGDFHHTAAIVRNLDLVITCDSSAAHLAGALGVPVWAALAFVPDWRWLLERTDSPWYPTMRLFRQTGPGDWEGVFQRIEQALADELAIDLGR